MLMKIQSFNHLLVIFVSIVLFAACGEEVEYAVNNSTVTMNVKDSVALSLSPAQSSWVFTTGDDDIATVSPSGIVKGMHMGKTIISVRNTLSGFSAQVNVTINSKNSLYREPCPTFNVDPLFVKKYEWRKLLSEGTMSTVVHVGEQASIITYLRYEADNTSHDQVVYFFDDHFKYFQSEVVVVDLYLTKLNGYLNDRCYPLSDAGSSFVPYITADSTMRIYTDNYMERSMILYTAADFDGYPTWILWGSGI